MDIYSSFVSWFDKIREEELLFEEYLNFCKNDLVVYVLVVEWMLMVIGELEKVDIWEDLCFLCIFVNKVIKVYFVFKEFYGVEEVIE